MKKRTSSTAWAKTLKPDVSPGRIHAVQPHAQLGTARGSQALAMQLGALLSTRPTKGYSLDGHSVLLAHQQGAWRVADQRKASASVHRFVFGRTHHQAPATSTANPV